MEVLLLKNKINKKVFSINRLPKSIIIPSEKNLNFVRMLEKEIEDKYFKKKKEESHLFFFLY